MSRGPGRIERAIAAILDGEPDSAFTIEELAGRVYRGLNRVEKKHRVAVLRAAARVAARRPLTGYDRSWARGGTLVYFNQDNVTSYALARCKSSGWQRTEAELREGLVNPEHHHYEMVQPGGVWWHHVQSWKEEHAAKIAGDEAKLNAVLAQREAFNNEIMRKCGLSVSESVRASGIETQADPEANVVVSVSEPGHVSGIETHTPLAPLVQEFLEMPDFLRRSPVASAP